MDVGHELAVGELYEIAQQAARSQCRSRPWLDVDDVAHEALVEMLAALRRLTERPASLTAYLGRVAYTTAWAYAWTLTSPLRHSKFRRGLGHAVAAIQRESDAVLADAADSSPTAETWLAERQWQAAVRREVEACFAEDPALDRALMRRVLLEEQTQMEAATAEQVPVQHVYVVTLRTKRRILARATAQALWRDLPSREGEELSDG